MLSMYVGNYNIFHRPDEANIVGNQQKLVCTKITFTLKIIDNYSFEQYHNLWQNIMI